MTDQRTEEERSAQELEALGIKPLPPIHLMRLSERTSALLEVLRQHMPALDDDEIVRLALNELYLKDHGWFGKQMLLPLDRTTAKLLTALRELLPDRSVGALVKGGLTALAHQFEVPASEYWTPESDRPKGIADPEREDTEQEEEILSGPERSRLEVHRKQVGKEEVYRYLIAYGSDEQGYILSYEEHFSPNTKGGPDPELDEVIFTTEVFASLEEAMALALPQAQKEEIED